jgi:L-ascorbate metabolism protein UlaG (beta-lactamase superfamily)
MRIQWFGQSAFALGDGARTVFIDPFAGMDALRGRGRRWDYPPIQGQRADLLLVTHEHLDHNGVEVIGGEPRVIRSTAGTFESPTGTVCAVASEHDQVAGTQRGPNTIYAFAFGGLRVCHFGDFGQDSLRPAQRSAIGVVDLLFLPVGGSATIDGATAAAIARELRPRWLVPMHYRTAAIDFLDPVDGLIEAASDLRVERLSTCAFEMSELPRVEAPLIVVPEPPMR